MTTGLLILISAPSGAGKTSLVDAALARDENLLVSVSHTTRKKRENEAEGVNYHFVDEATFEQMIDAGAFLEHAMVFGNRYGTSKAGVQAQRDAGRDVILEIDWQGAAQVRKLSADALSVFILPPSKSALRERLEQRGQDSEESINKRLAEAELDMSQARDYDYVIVNDDFDTALGELCAILAAERLRTPAQLANNPVVADLL